MEEGKQSFRPSHPREKSNFLEHLFFCWQIPVLVKGWRKEIDENDIYAPLDSHRAEVLGDRIEELWFVEKKSKKPSLLKVLVKMFGLECLAYGLLSLPANLIFTFCKPVFLKKILDYFTSDEEVPVKAAYLNAGLITLTTFLYVWLLNFVANQMFALGIKTKTACSSLMYRYLLTLKKVTVQRITLGRILNLLSTDVGKLEAGLIFCHYIWIAPLQIILSAGYVCVTLDYRATSGIGVVLLLVLVEVGLASRIYKNRSCVAKATDQRLRLVNDVITGIQVIKMHSWEVPFAELVQNARRLEIKELKKANYYRFLTTSFPQLLPICVFVIVIIFVLMDSSLSPQYIYSAMNIYSDLITSTLLIMPISIIYFLEFCVSVRRIQEFLLFDQQQTNIFTKNEAILYTEYQNKKKHGVVLENATAAVDGNTVLEEITFQASSGELVGVIGKTGSGKSLLLQLILKEIEIVRGSVNVDGDVSYASQNSWIFSSTLRQNILFGEEFDLEKYRQVISICALERDISTFPHGDRTLVGERGLMLSGGQKARINLARAVYKNADIYLLDDPLSAVDGQVANHIYDECIRKYLKEKCVILITHHVNYLKNASRLYVVEDGRLYDCEADKSFTLEETKEEKPEREKTSGFNNNQKPEMLKEHRTAGIKSFSVYKRYCQAAGSWWFTFAVLLLFVLSQSFSSFVDYFLSYWINYEKTFTASERKYHLTVYAILAFFLILSLYASYYVTILFCASASTNLHNRLLSKILSCPMSFFNYNPSGRIINRFSRDINSVDETLPLSIVYFLLQILPTIGLLIVLSVTNYYMIIASVVLCLFVILFGVVFQPTNRNIKRTEGITRSYVFSHLVATLQGLATIRASKARHILSEEFDKHQDLHASAAYLYSSVFDCFAFWIAFASVVYSGIFIFSFILLPLSFHTASVGIAITLVTRLCEMSPLIGKTVNELETQMTSVERVVEYVDLGAESNDGSVIPPETWPSMGYITFDSVTMKYSPEKPPVLKQVTFHVFPGEKIGIVGRTGAGKTSLISALFRLFPFEGSIIIDAINTKSIPLNRLRSKISIIPQDPVLFLGSLRKNLDPCDEFTDAKICRVLDELDLRALFSDLPNGLDTQIAEGGCNFSVGQRQLLCLVRSMLRESKIIVLDEATANVDTVTDEMIQSVVKKKFGDCTVLTIAHRLNTVIGADRILVMDGGSVVEFEQPYALLQDERSYFYGFVKENGEGVMEELMKIAQDLAKEKASK